MVDGDSTGDMTSKDARQFFTGKPTPTTLSRWIRGGVLNRDTGERVILEFDRAGGQLRFKREYLTRFIAALNRKASQ